MMNKEDPKILILTRGAWRDDNNSGNTFTNLFGGWEKDRIANLYVSPELPDNSVCAKYYQINDRMLLNNILKGGMAGREIDYSRLQSGQITQAYDNKRERKIYDLARIYRLQIFFAVREMLWKTARWKNESLYAFLKDFSPDVIFAPLYDCHYMHELTRYAAEVTGKKVVTMIWDDIYTYRQFSLSPIFWINRFLLRKNIRKTMSICSRIYIMAPRQKEEYDRIFNIESRILCKGGDFSRAPADKPSDSLPLKIVYTGNIFAGRWKTLTHIAGALKKINKQGTKAQLFVYTQNPVSKRMKKGLVIPGTSFLMGGIPFSMVKQVLAESDIVVHAESLELRNRLLTRLSFSTKIVDYFESGRCILAAGSREAASIDYLVKNNAAIVVEGTKEIEPALRRLLEEPGLISEYGRRAWDCGRMNHDMNKIRSQLKQDLRGMTEVSPSMVLMPGESGQLNFSKYG
ncbi:MAG: hypothetical protein ACM3S2_16930 [Ignavibacteriales bacterium]